MFLTRYLYTRVMQTDTKFASLILGKDEEDFLKKYDIEYHKEKGRYIVNCDELKSLFCHC